MTDLIVIGGGLAGSEAAWQAAQQGLSVDLYEMRPALSTGAHETDYLAELVCSNSLGSNQPDRASGALKNELRRLGSMLLECAESAALPAVRPWRLTVNTLREVSPSGYKTTHESKSYAKKRLKYQPA